MKKNHVLNHSITHSPSLFDDAGTKAITSFYFSQLQLERQKNPQNVNAHMKWNASSHVSQSRPGYGSILRNLLNIQQIVHACSVIVGCQCRIKQHWGNTVVWTKWCWILLHQTLVVFWQVTWSASIHWKTHQLNNLNMLARNHFSQWPGLTHTTAVQLYLCKLVFDEDSGHCCRGNLYIADKLPDAQPTVSKQ